MHINSTNIPVLLDKIFFSHNCYKLKFVYGECGKKVGMQNTKTLFCMEKNRPYAKSGACQ
jgi:hypothetical protein